MNNIVVNPFCVRRFITVIFSTSLFLLLHPCIGQKSNKPNFLTSGREPLGERDNSFAGSGGGKHKFFSFKKKGFNHSKKTQSFSAPKKYKREGFTKKKYTAKKSLFGKKSSSWGGKSFRKNGKEDKRLFKSPKNKSKDRKRRILKKHNG